jgi:hypothetical protein
VVPSPVPLPTVPPAQKATSTTHRGTNRPGTHPSGSGGEGTSADRLRQTGYSAQIL